MGLRSLILWKLVFCLAPFQALAGQVQPGSEKPDAVMASLMFKQVCGDTLPRFSRVKDELNKLPFTQDADTGIFYHNNINLSFALGSLEGDRACSMVIVMPRRERGIPLKIAVSAFNDVWDSDATVIQAFEKNKHIEVKHPKGHILKVFRQNDNGRQVVYSAVIKAAR